LRALVSAHVARETNSSDEIIFMVAMGRFPLDKTLLRKAEKTAPHGRLAVRAHTIQFFFRVFKAKRYGLSAPCKI